MLLFLLQFIQHVVYLIKVFLHLSRTEQGNRIRQRLVDPDEQHEFDDHDMDVHTRCWLSHH